MNNLVQEKNVTRSGFRKLYAAGVTLLVFLAIPISNVYAAEDRCDKLGAACVCSEPLNTNSYVAVNSQAWNPSDSVTKQCSHEIQNAPISIGGVGSDEILFSNDASVLAALPSGNTVNYILRAFDGKPNYKPWKVGITNLDSGWYGTVPKKRVAMRFYMYHSPDFSFANAGDGESNNTKFLEGTQINSGFWDNNMGVGSHAYTVYNWEYNGGTGYADVKASYSNPINTDQMKGIWLRYELVVTNRDGGSAGDGTRIELYMKDVTNGTPELKVWDSYSDVHISGYITLGNDARPVRSGRNRIMTNFYTNNWRQDRNNGIPMKGFRALSHYMFAAWDTNLGQRIGSALEVEGVSGQFGISGTPPVDWNIADYSITLE